MHFCSRLPVILLMTFLTVAVTLQTTEAQSFRIVTVNTFTGALTGSALGGATMALQNQSDDYYPLRFGLGIGTIMGLGTGFYDLSKMTGSDFYVNGLINTANSTGTIILLDTFYGSATGAIVGVAVSLMTNANILKGIQYGSGSGAWAGFAFGLLDAFVISAPGEYDSFYDEYSHNAGRHLSTASHTGGLLHVRGDDNRYAIGFLNPLLFNTTGLSEYGALTNRTQFGIEFTHINIAL
ncbi:MAG: hypothetical protein WD097_09140 [Balneolales bacterium]